MLASHPAQETPSGTSLREHYPLPTWVTGADYLLTLVFLIIGPFFYYSEAVFRTGYSALGEAIMLTGQLGLHFMVAYYFLTNHFMEPMTREVRLILMAWRVLMTAWVALLMYGFQQYRHPFLG